jgi:Zn-dependent protease
MGGMDWWVSSVYQNGGISMLLAWIFWVIGSIVLHELAHGWVAIRSGDNTPRESGHMTWNPLVHMGFHSLLFFAVLGIAWGAMPVNPDRFRDRYDPAKVAAAGPAMNLGLALVCAVGFCVWLPLATKMWFPSLDVPEHVGRNVLVFFELGLMLNLVLMMFNLLPVPPLDGSRIVGNFSWRYERFWQGEHAQWIALAALVGLFFFGGKFLFPVARDLSDEITGAISRGLFRVFPPHAPSVTP